MRRRTFSDWFKAAEGWSLPASAMSVLSICGWLAGRPGIRCDWINAALALAMMMLFQAGSSTLSDCCDHVRGVDGPDDPKVTWIYSGLIPLPALYRYAAVLLGLGSLAGGVILLRGCRDAAVLGVAGLALGLGYSFLKYRACGDIAIFLAFALLPALGVGRVVGGAWMPETLLVVLPVGFVTVSIVHANNCRDAATDRAAGIRTLPMVIGARAARLVYALETLLPYVLVAAFAATGLIPRASLVTLAALPLAILNLRADLRPLDRLSARHQLVFGSLYAGSCGSGMFWY